MISAPATSRLTASAVLLAASFLVVFTAISPSHAAAQTVSTSVQTLELLPPGQNTCKMISVSSVEPHVYAGILESFDVTISDVSNSYVGVLAQVGKAPIPLAFITRWAGAPDGLRIHVDTADIIIKSALPVKLTLLSSPPGAPTCVTTVSFDVSLLGARVPRAVSSSTSPVHQPKSVSGSPSLAPAPTQSPSMIDEGKPNGTVMQLATSSMQNNSSTSVPGSAVASAGNMRLFDSLCTGGNVYRLWFILLFLYLVLVAIVVFAEPDFLKNSVIGSTAAILVPLILLLAFWYLSASCRAASWIPVVACVIAIAGLFLAFREYELPPLLPAPSEQ